MNSFKECTVLKKKKNAAINKSGIISIYLIISIYCEICRSAPLDKGLRFCLQYKFDRRQKKLIDVSLNIKMKNISRPHRPLTSNKTMK